MSNESNDFLLGSSSPSAKFPTIGTIITGTITEPPVVGDQRDLDGNIKTWDDGSTMKQLIVTLSTNLRDASIEDDDGTRRLFVSGSKKPESMSMTAAIGGAVRAAKANGLEVGGKLTVKYIADGVPPKKGFNAPKQYAATYEPPSVQASAEFLESEPVTAPAAPAAPAVPTQTPAQLANDLLAQGLDISDVATATGLPMATCAALRNTIAA
jgi:hypothetical protein